MRVAVLCTNFQPDNGWATVAVKRSAALMKLGVEIVAVTSKKRWQAGRHHPNRHQANPALAAHKKFAGQIAAQQPKRGTQYLGL